MFGVAVHCLEIIIQNDDNSRKGERKSVTEANGLLHNFCSSSFLVDLNYGPFTSSIGKVLQKQTMDVINLHVAIKLSITELHNVRVNTEEEFGSILKKQRKL